MKDKVLITGASGFIGSHLTERCVDNGFEVKVLIHYNSRNNWGWLENSSCKDDIEVITGDIRDYDNVYNAMKGCHSVFHLAALIGIPYSYVSPIAYIKTNIEGTYNVLQSAREIELNNLLITSTSETYGTAQYVPMDENHPLIGQSPYSATKIAADQLAISYYRSFNIPVKIVRPFNTYGPRQSARAVIPTVISQLLSGKTPLMIGNIEPTRDFTFVKDTVAAFLEISKSDSLVGQVTNVGIGSDISIRDIALLIGKILDVKVEFKVDSERVRPEKSEVERLFCDNKKIMTYTNWRPKYSIEKGLAETIDWLKDNIDIYKPSLYNI